LPESRKRKVFANTKRKTAMMRRVRGVCALLLVGYLLVPGRMKKPLDKPKQFGFIGRAMKNKAAASLGRLGGKVKSEAKTESARENGKKGGRPVKELIAATMCGKDDGTEDAAIDELVSRFGFAEARRMCGHED
jgi:hypothetical protein